MTKDSVKVSTKEVNEFITYLEENISDLTEGEGVHLPSDYETLPFVNNPELETKLNQYKTNDLMNLLIQETGKEPITVVIELLADSYENNFALHQEVKTLRSEFNKYQQTMFKYVQTLQADLVAHNQTINNQLNLTIKLLTSKESIESDKINKSEPIKTSKPSPPPPPPQTQPKTQPISLRGSILTELKEVFKKNKKRQDQDQA